MSLNVYLKDEEVRKVDGFEINHKTAKGNQTWNEYALPGIKLWHEKGRWYIILHEPTEPIPPLVANIVDEISFHESFRKGI